jgi:putative radical SAM enzyme (TIGR03279 family)
MPRGLRPSLYVRDDDYRLSFLTGSFVTLTNLTEADWERIETQGLSPLYVSVHATDPATRARLLGKATIPDIRQQLERLADLGVEVHTQVVLVPGVNDGRILEQTVADLSALYPSVASVSLVPVGLTRFQRAPIRRHTAGEAKALLVQVAPWRDKFRREFGVNFVYPSDEFCLLAEAGVPRASEYDGFPQIENGVGLVRAFLDDWARVRRRLAGGEASVPQRMTWVTGVLFAPVLQKVAEWLRRERALNVDVVPVPNRFFGETVTVAGLLTAEDVVAALQGRELADWVILPRAMLDHEGALTLDDRSPDWLEQTLGARVAFADGMSDLPPSNSRAGFLEDASYKPWA